MKTLPRMLPAFLLFACANPLAGKWKGDDLPVQISADANVLIRAEVTFGNDVKIAAKVRTTTEIELGTIELVGAYATASSKDTQLLTIEIDTITVKTIAGELVAVDERNQAAGGRFLCFPLNNVEACIERTQNFPFAVDGDTLRFFFTVAGVNLAAPFTRVK